MHQIEEELKLELDKDNDGALTPKEFAENSVEDPFAEIRKDDPGMLPTGPLPGSSKARERPLLVKINLAAKLQRDLAEKERELDALTTSRLSEHTSSLESTHAERVAAVQHAHQVLRVPRESRPGPVSLQAALCTAVRP